jgi:hypothetical protein
LRAEVVAIEGYLESRYVLDPSKSKIEFAEQFRIEVDEDHGVFRIDDISNPPRSAFSYKDFLLDQSSVSASAEDMTDLQRAIS